MMRSVALALLVVTFVAAIQNLPDLKERVQFTVFMKKYNKVYSSAEEFEKRFGVFQQGLQKIKIMNAQSKNATFGVTQFSDMTPEEFRSTVLMKNPITPNPNKEAQGILPARVSVDALPAALDWRTKGAVTPVKNQEQCGSCWAFSATENIESMWILAGKSTNSSVNLAPQQIVDCDTSDDGCDGGNPPTAYEYVISAGGQDSEASYPYTAVDGTCAFKQQNVMAKISNWQYATSDYSETTLQQNLVGWGPLSICVDAANWQYYTSGVMDWEQCAWVNILDHCVQLVGYNAASSAPTPYWIVRNSWGTTWGVEGYIWLAMGGDTCGLTHEATSSIV